MPIQVLLGMNFDNAVVFVKTFLLLFRLALAILCSFNREMRVQAKRTCLAILFSPQFQLLNKLQTMCI